LRRFPELSFLAFVPPARPRLLGAFDVIFPGLECSVT